MAFTTLQPGPGWFEQLQDNQTALKGSTAAVTITGLNGWDTSNLRLYDIDTPTYALTIMSGQVTYKGNNVNSFNDYIGTIPSGGIDPMNWQHCIISGYGKFGELVNDNNGKNQLKATMPFTVGNNTVYQVFGMIVKKK